MMSAPFPGPPAAAPATGSGRDLGAALAALRPPRKHYQWYYSERRAEPDMLGAPEGLQTFLRAYYHVKSGDWPGNRPRPLAGWSADQLALLPDYYVMPLAATMPEAVAPFMPAAAAIAACDWLTDAELAVYARAFQTTGLQGGLHWYRCATSGLTGRQLRLFARRKIEAPALFIAGAADWGVHQSPGVFEAMQSRACADFRGARLIDGAGHWVQPEAPAAVIERLLAFLATV
jgi:pimeloyl-ACP methyl ester carboxylesterase